MKNTTFIKSANDFIDKLTNYNVVERTILGKKQPRIEYKSNYKGVHNFLTQRVDKNISLIKIWGL